MDQPGASRKLHGRILKGRIGRTSRPIIRQNPLNPTGFMRVKMDIALHKRALSPVRLVLEDSPKRSFMLFVVVSLQLGCIMFNLILSNARALRAQVHVVRRIVLTEQGALYFQPPLNSRE